MSLDIVITNEANNGKRISIAGSLDSNTAAKLQQSIDTEINETVSTTIIDFKDLDFLSSAGLRVLLSAAKEMRRREGKIVLCSLNEFVKEIFEVSGFQSLIPIADSVESGIEVLS